MSEPYMPILSRVERLDLMMDYLEEKRSSAAGISKSRNSSCASSTRSTSSSGNTAASNGGGGNYSSVTSSSPKSTTLEKKIKCRPIDDVVMETQLKGNLVDRVHHLEIRLLKLEQDIDKEIRGEEEEARMVTSNTKKKNTKHRKGLRSLVRSCIKGKLDTKT